MTAKLAQQNDDVIRQTKNPSEAGIKSGQGKNFGHKVFPSITLTTFWPRNLLR